MINLIGNFMWLLFIPFLGAIAIYIVYKYNKDVKDDIKGEKIHLRKMLGQISISLGTMIGTGAIIGVLGSLSSIYILGQ